MKNRGVSLLEYAIVGALVVVVSIPVLMATSQEFNTWLTSLVANLQGNIQATRQAEARRQAEAAAAAATARPNANTATTPSSAILSAEYTGPVVNGVQVLPPPRPDQQRVCMEGGFCLNVPKMAAGANPTTVGSNGTEFVSTYAMTLDQLVKQLESNPDVDPTLRTLVTTLANKGHELASVENQAKQHLDPTAMSMYYGSGETQTASMNLSIKQDDFWMAKESLDAYLARHPGALPPAMKSMIHAGAENIDEVVAVYQDHLNYQIQNAYAMDQESGRYYRNLTRPTVAVGDKITEVSANGICGTGGNAVECTRNLYGSEPKVTPIEPDPASLVTTHYQDGTVVSEPSYARYKYVNKRKGLATPGSGDGGDGDGGGGDGDA